MKEAVLILTLFLTGCAQLDYVYINETINQTDFTKVIKKDIDSTWVEKDPIQCFGNLWEIDWLKTHNYSYSAYPEKYIDNKINKELVDIIRDYYMAKGIVVLDLNVLGFGEIEGKPDELCLACNCADGYTIFIKIPNSNVTKIIDEDFKISEYPDIILS